MKLIHGRVSLWLHRLRDGEGLPLLCLPELGASGADWDAGALDWPGPVHALDYAGHGRSGRVLGGVYSSELLAGDADAALAALGSAALVGAGLGAYVALLLAGARPDLVPAALLLPGRGLEGGGAEPDFEGEQPKGVSPVSPEDDGADPQALRWLDRELRPPDYATHFARRAKRLLLADDGCARPDWWEEIGRVEGVVRIPISGGPSSALRALAEPLFP